jgi:hypothetical protein
MGVALATADGMAADGADDGLGLEAGVVGRPAIVDGGAALGVALGADGTVAHAEPSKTNAINQRRIADKHHDFVRLVRLLCRRERVRQG